jgi:hypothetical protein
VLVDAHARHGTIERMRGALLTMTLVISAAAAADPAPAQSLSPVAMAGPFKNALSACIAAPPCGFSDLDPKTLKEIKPQKVAVCPSLKGDAVDPNGGATDMHHASKSSGLELRLASQHCASPDGLPGEHDIYFALVKRDDGWWRSAPLWQWDYGDKFTSGSMVVRWNDHQPGRTFAGVAASISHAACDRQGTYTETIEMMLRMEPGAADAKPLVWGPLLVGEREAQEGEPECKPYKRATELTEQWSGSDDVELTGSGRWSEPFREDGVIQIGLGAPVKPGVGRYHFAR